MDASGFDTFFTKRRVPHILVKIFSSLDNGSFMKCREVCKDWNELFSSERYQNEEEKKRIIQEKFCKLFQNSSVRNVEEVRYLLSRGADTNCEIHHGIGLKDTKTTPLILSVKDGQTDVVQLLQDDQIRPFRSHFRIGVGRIPYFLHG